MDEAEGVGQPGPKRRRREEEGWHRHRHRTATPTRTATLVVPIIVADDVAIVGGTELVATQPPTLLPLLLPPRALKVAQS